MQETIEPPAKVNYAAEHRITRTAASRLRILADWLDAHEVYDCELLCANTDGWDEKRVHVKPDTAMRLLEGKNVTILAGGHIIGVLDGVQIVAVPDKKPQPAAAG